MSQVIGEKTAAVVQSRVMPASDGRGSLAVPLVKICGITREADLAVLNETLPEFAGFVFAPGSRRQVDLATAVRLRAGLDHRIATVGVFIDQPVATVVGAVVSGAIGVVQLHGQEGADDIAAVRQQAPGARIIKAVRVNEVSSIREAAGLGADWLLLDSGTGSGQTFDWALVAAARQQAADSGQEVPPYFLAGGLTPENVAGGIVATRPAAVDVSSGVETDHVKDPVKIRAFVAAVRNVSGCR
jgi:phosphoribosylanthranilate isomerase